MNKAPSFDDVFAVMSAASVGDLTARVAVPDSPQLDDTATKFAIALNILLDDLTLRARELEDVGDVADWERAPTARGRTKPVSKSTLLSDRRMATGRACFMRRGVSGMRRQAPRTSP
jgi:hypothetical protein